MKVCEEIIVQNHRKPADYIKIGLFPPELRKQVKSKMTFLSSITNIITQIDLPPRK